MYAFESLRQLSDQRETLPVHARKSYRDYGINTKRFIAIHHSLTASGSARSFAKYHVRTNDWPGIGYHL
ncbi:hypothetical protein G4V62_02355 [Bacillaceae bacterium SIJ1]|uniref:hypothetical protein n=1 Tax=Litoribacterium kuwaitense TaxID=1398745 RepID=UPI0013ED2028|nr:hypothetical protein [Litoribacterium kuwaitense]NGP43846.1 hypothetical protein [Litoribacterium kuwaitense]